MAQSKSLRNLAVVFFISGLYDAFGGDLLRVLSRNRTEHRQPTHTPLLRHLYRILFVLLCIPPIIFCFQYPTLSVQFRCRDFRKTFLCSPLIGVHLARGRFPQDVPANRYHRPVLVDALHRARPDEQ